MHRIAGHDVGAADVLVERAGIGEGDAGGGNGAPKRRGRIDHGGGLLVGDLAVQGTLIDVIIDRSAGPVDGLADDGGIEKAGSGHIFGSAGRGRRGREDERQSDEAGRDALPAGADGNGTREALRTPECCTCQAVSAAAMLRDFLIWNLAGGADGGAGDELREARSGVGYGGVSGS